MTYFCYQVAQTNKLELLKWIREDKKCEWDSRTIHVAAGQYFLEMVKYCVANDCPIDGRACASAAKTVISSASNTYRIKDWRTAAWAAKNGSPSYTRISCRA